ncbi:DUF998 domain-containing protein [Microlunatus soli]|uniref:DUF998 domain-containing protein n=1 Tax=Microlunatus soli TaxID=630515 RepID=A0A1H1PXP8_9ACTN|nr:DUF998 domain-containing protein [Microlunatus soli]SDS15992.1 Protein of unknown function [Microlunatus soli]
MTDRITSVPVGGRSGMISNVPSRRDGPSDGNLVDSNPTRWLLRCMAVAGPCYVVISLLQAFTRTGFDPRIHEWSLLALGSLGWIQTANLILTGALLVAGAVGLARAFPTRERGRRFAAALLAGYGVSCVAAGAFAADPAYGFPVGAPDGRPPTSSLHALLHLTFGGLGFLCLIICCFVVARIAARHRRIRDAWISLIVGVLFSCSFAGIATGAGNPVINLAFTGAIVLSFGWLTAVAAVLLGRLGRGLQPAPGPGRS